MKRKIPLDGTPNPSVQIPIRVNGETPNTSEPTAEQKAQLIQACRFVVSGCESNEFWREYAEREEIRERANQIRTSTRTEWTAEFKAAIAAFAARLQSEQEAGYRARYGTEHPELCANATKVSVHYGKTWVRVDIGSSGRYMVDAEGNIVGIKAYGVPHPGHRFGTLATVAAWNWSGYRGLPIARNS